MDIRQLREKGLLYRQTAEELGIDPRIVAKYCGNEAEQKRRLCGPAS